MQTRRYHCYVDSALLCADVARRIVELANQSIDQSGRFRIVLAGGNTPQVIYQQLCQADTDWSAWQVFYGDERCLPVGDTQRNDHMAELSWLSHVAISADQIYAIPAELGAEAGAQEYAQNLADIDDFNLVLLGLGEDGHTASLFPGHEHPRGTKAVAVSGSPKPPAQRVSLSTEMLGSSEQVWFIVTGEGKRQALSQWQQGAAIPASLVQPAAGVDIFTDLNVC